MKSTIGLALASGLALFLAGCASGAGGGAAAGGTVAGPSGGSATGAVAKVDKEFNLAVKCPGIHYLKKKGWSDQAIVQQMQVMEDDIPTCEAWTASQPKGFVPPPPSGNPAAAKLGTGTKDFGPTKTQ